MTEGDNKHEMNGMHEPNERHEAHENHEAYRNPERLLAGADHPRPLSPPLRARLEELLEGAGAGSAARPLPGKVRVKLEDSLLPDEPSNEGVPDEEPLFGAPGNGAPEDGAPEKKWRVWAPRLSVAAAVIIALAIFVPTLAHGPGPTTPHVAVGTQASRSGLSILKAVAPKATTVPSTSPAYGAANGTGNRTGNGTGNRTGNGTGRAIPSTSAPGTHAGAPALPAAAPPAVVRPGASGSGGPQAAFGVPEPVVSNLSPATGPASGGNWVVVRGTDLGGATAVHFGQTKAVHVVAVSATELKAMAPAHPVGTVDVVVIGPGGQSLLSPQDRYAFTRQR